MLPHSLYNEVNKEMLLLTELMDGNTDKEAHRYIFSIIVNLYIISNFMFDIRITFRRSRWC